MVRAGGGEPEFVTASKRRASVRELAAAGSAGAEAGRRLAGDGGDGLHQSWWSVLRSADLWWRQLPWAAEVLGKGSQGVGAGVASSIGSAPVGGLDGGDKAPTRPVVRLVRLQLSALPAPEMAPAQRTAPTRRVVGYHDAHAATQTAGSSGSEGQVGAGGEQHSRPPLHRDDRRCSGDNGGGALTVAARAARWSAAGRAPHEEQQQAAATKTITHEAASTASQAQPVVATPPKGTWGLGYPFRRSGPKDTAYRV